MLIISRLSEKFGIFPGFYTHKKIQQQNLEQSECRNALTA